MPIWILFQILGKAEFLNPGGSVKDRVAVKIIEEVMDPFPIGPLLLFVDIVSLDFVVLCV